MTMQAGQTLLHYRLIEKIGEGGMGVVWKAQDTSLEREIALKLLPDSFAADPRRRARFEQEAKAVAALNHPNIVTIFSVEEDGDHHFLTMELVNGRPLTALIQPGGLPLTEFLRIAVPMADAVGRVHEQGITHGDIKPGNVVVDDDQVKILDFGLARSDRTEQFGRRPKTRPTPWTSREAFPARCTTWRLSESRANRPITARTSSRWG